MQPRLALTAKLSLQRTDAALKLTALVCQTCRKCRPRRTIRTREVLNIIGTPISVQSVTYFHFQFPLFSAFIARLTEREVRPNFRLFDSKLASKKNFSTYS